MKVLVNGGLNLSELDGWWAEAYSPEVGWAIGDGQEHGDDPAWDAQEAEDLYALLEREVVPEFYERDEANMPSKWLGRIRESMARLTPEFSATRAIREYTENHYLPAASNYQQRAAEDSKQGLVVLHWRQELDRHWNAVGFGAVRVETHDGQHFFQVEVSLGTLKPDQIRGRTLCELRSRLINLLLNLCTHRNPLRIRQECSRIRLRFPQLAHQATTRRASFLITQMFLFLWKRGRFFGSAEL